MKNMNRKPLVAVVTPCYNEKEGIALMYDALNEMSQQTTEYEFKFIFVNDGSKDRTWIELNKLADQDDRVKLVNLSRNSGHQNAVTAGLSVINDNDCDADACVIIDADRQDPPCLIPNMLKLWDEGFDMVYGVRTNRPGESKFKLITAKYFYRILNWLSDVDIPEDTGDFRLVDRRMVDIMNASKEHNKFLRGMWASFGFKAAPFLYERRERTEGETHYPLKKMLQLAGNGAFGFSKKPITAIGLGGAFLMVMAVIFFFASLFTGSTWTLCGVNFVGGLLMLALYIMG